MAFLTAMTMADRILGSAPFVCEGDFSKAVEQAARLGYDGVELHLADPAKLDLPALQASLQQWGRRLTGIGTGRAYVNEGLSLTDPDPAGRKAAGERLESFIRLGQETGATVIIGCMRGNVSEQCSLQQALDLLHQSMVRLDRLAGDAGVTLVFEPINRYENNFLCTLEEVGQFLEQSGLQHTGILADTFHMNIEEPDPIASIGRWGGRIRYVHLADSNRHYPGGGHIDFPAVLAALDRAGYHGVLSAECLPYPTKEAAAQGWIEAVRRLTAG